MEYYGDILCVTVSELTRSDDGEAVMTRAAYNHLVVRHSCTVARPGKGKGSYALVEWASLPGRFRSRFIEKYGDPEKIMKRETTYLPQDAEAQRFYHDHILPDGRHIPEGKQAEYTLNARALNALTAMANGQRAAHRAGNNNTPVIWASVTRECERLRDAYGHTLPRNEASLRRKMREYARDGYACLVSGKFGNSSALKITPEAERYIVALRRCATPVYSTEGIFEEYNRKAAEKGWKPLGSVTTLRTLLERPDIKPKWYDAVYGELAATQVYSRRHKTVMPSMRDSLWYGDGTKLNLFYKDYEGGKLVVKTAYVYEVSDAMTDALLGYAVGKTETFALQYGAFRMAVEFSGHKPYEIVTDNQGGQKSKKAQAFFKGICHISRTTAPYQPEGKTIERLFGSFQRQVLSKDWRFTGQNISSKNGWRINRELVDANKESLYTWPELLEAYAKARDEWNAMDGRMDAYLASANPKAEAVTEIDKVSLFWISTDKAVPYTANGISFQHAGARRTYEVMTADGRPDYGFLRNNTGREFVCKYDPMSMDRALLFEEGPSGLRYAATAYPYLTVHRNIQEQTDEDKAFIRESVEESKKERIRRRIEAQALETEFGVSPEQNGLKTPVLKGISESDYEKYADIVMAVVPKEGGAAAAGTTETTDIGPYTKAVSNMDYNPLDILGKI